MNEKLTEMSCSSEGSRKAIEQLYEDGMMNFSNFDKIYQELTTSEWDSYQVSGDMINQFINEDFANKICKQFEDKSKEV